MAKHHQGRPSRSSGSACRWPRPASSVDDLGQSLKVEHIDDELHKYGVLSFYRQGEFVDLCRGPHIPHAGKVGAFKLLSIAGAYWKGHTDSQMLQRVYGTAFFDKKDLDAYLAQVEEAKKRDHRKLGKELGLFTISPLVGSGLILWMPKGAIVRGVLESFLKDELIKRGYQPVYTPHIGKIELYKTSGHYPYYKDSQFPVLADARRRGDGAGRRAGKGRRSTTRRRRSCSARPASPSGCPRRATSTAADSPARLLDARQGRADQVRRGARRERGIPPQADELPAPHPDLRRPAAELSRPARAAGRVRHGLPLRAVGRALRPDPGPRVHPGRRPPVLHRRAGPRRVPRDDGADPVRARQPGPDRLQAPALEARPERPQVQGRGRRHLAARRGATSAPCSTRWRLPYEEAPGEAAFYGPKADFIVRDCIGRQWQLGTVQLDYVLPERFGLEYTGPGQPAAPAR